MRATHGMIFALVVGAAVFPAASALTTICTFPTVPVGACVTVTIDSQTIYYNDPNVGPTYHYTCDPFAIVCAQTPDITWTQRSITVPMWVDTSGSYVWCTVCPAIGGESIVAPLLP